MLSMILSVYGFVALVFLAIMIIALVVMLCEIHDDVECDAKMIAWIIFAIILVSCVWPLFVIYMLTHKDEDDIDKNETRSDEVPEELTLEMHEETFAGTRKSGD